MRYFYSFVVPVILGISTMLFAPGCSGRRVLLGPEDGRPARDDGGEPLKPDACVRPPGGCFSDADCPEGSTCQGCGPDPCCPQCAVCYGRCVPATGGCVDNPDCRAGEYCNRDTICRVTGAIMGRCLQRPVACDAVYDPVCGCDEKTYNNACTAAAQGVSYRHKGACPSPSCSDLSKEYAGIIEAARTCCPACAALQCTLKVASELACPCDTYVNLLTGTQQQRLAELRSLWQAGNCGRQGPGTCKPCPEVRGGACSPTPGNPPQNGRCEDI